MGILAWMATFAAGWWVLARIFGTKATQEKAQDAGKRSLRATTSVVTDLFGSAGGQRVPDLGPPPIDRFEDDSSPNVIRVDRPEP